jgi:DNA-binding SARP family transcriptional activator
MLRITTVGGLAVELGGDDRTPAAVDRPAALLAWLALHPGEHSRSSVASRFWPDGLDESARASLRSALWSLRRGLGDEADGAIVATRDRVGLADGVWVDLHAAEALRAAGKPEEALALLDGELLPGFDDEWVLDARDAHRAAVVGLLEELAAAAEADGDLRRAVECSRRAAALEPLSEEVCRSLMRRHVAADDRASALAAYGELRTRLLQTLRVGPSEATQLLAAEIRDGAEPRRDAPASLLRADAEPFVGRHAELARMRGLWQGRDARARAQVILLAGEAGCGKTRLAARFAAEAHARGATVLHGTCRRHPLLPYEPLSEALGLPAAAAADAATVQERLAAAGPALLVLDDLQWAGARTLDAVSRLLRDAAGVTLVATLRDEEAAPALTAAIADLRRECDVERVRVGGLTLADVRLLIAADAGTRAAGGHALAIHERSGGNPFFARELARHVADAGGMAFADVPEGVRDVVVARVEQLGAATAEVLTAAAALGESFELSVLERVAGCGPDGVLDALEAAAAAGLLDEVGAGSFRFPHALTRDAVYSSTGMSRRARLHGRAAAALEAAHGVDAGPHLGEIARHLCAAGPAGGDPCRASDLAARAAAWASERGGFEQAVQLLTRALHVLPEAEAERRRQLTRSRAVAFSRLSHVAFDAR